MARTKITSQKGASLIASTRRQLATQASRATIQEIDSDYESSTAQESQCQSEQQESTNISNCSNDQHNEDESIGSFYDPNDHNTLPEQQLRSNQMVSPVQAQPMFIEVSDDAPFPKINQTQMMVSQLQPITIDVANHLQLEFMTSYGQGNLFSKLKEDYDVNANYSQYCSTIDKSYQYDLYVNRDKILDSNEINFVKDPRCYYSNFLNDSSLHGIGQFAFRQKLIDQNDGFADNQIVLNRIRFANAEIDNESKQLSNVSFVGFVNGRAMSFTIRDETGRQINCKPLLVQDEADESNAIMLSIEWLKSTSETRIALEKYVTRNYQMIFSLCHLTQCWLLKVYSILSMVHDSEFEFLLKHLNETWYDVEKWLGSVLIHGRKQHCIMQFTIPERIIRNLIILAQVDYLEMEQSLENDMSSSTYSYVKMKKFDINSFIPSKYKICPFTLVSSSEAFASLSEEQKNLCCILRIIIIHMSWTIRQNDLKINENNKYQMTGHQINTMEVTNMLVDVIEAFVALDWHADLKNDYRMMLKNVFDIYFHCDGANAKFDFTFESAFNWKKSLTLKETQHENDVKLRSFGSFPIKTLFKDYLFFYSNQGLDRHSFIEEKALLHGFSSDNRDSSNYSTMVKMWELEFRLFQMSVMKQCVIRIGLNLNGLFKGIDNQLSPNYHSYAEPCGIINASDKIEIGIPLLFDERDDSMNKQSATKYEDYNSLGDLGFVSSVTGGIKNHEKDDDDDDDDDDNSSTFELQPRMSIHSKRKRFNDNDHDNLF